MLSIVLRALLISAWLAFRAVVSLTPVLAEDRARPRICTSRLLISFRAPPAVWATFTAWFVLSMAVCRPAICACCSCEITKAAGPSAPVLILRPDDSRCNEVFRASDVWLRLPWAMSEATLFRIDSDIPISFV